VMDVALKWQTRHPYFPCPERGGIKGGVVTTLRRSKRPPPYLPLSGGGKK
jgi:hypothetical protein